MSTEAMKTAVRALKLRPLLSAIALLSLGVVAGCTSSALDIEPETKISPALARQIKAKGFKETDPVLVRIFKAESELEIWKRKPTGEYALFKTYPICRWSGKLGPKVKNGDRQAPEGFYNVSLGQLNPESQYYLSFNLGYPNRLEKALGHTGEALMVHGACSSSGCYALTDQGMSEIYPVVLKALQSGQKTFQVQSFPFRMTEANMRRHAGDPNMKFWYTLKAGYDAFEKTRREPVVGYCAGQYAFNLPQGSEPESPLGECPAGTLMASQQMPLMSMPKSVTAYSYSDGGMHKSYRVLLERYGAKRMAAKVSTTKYPVSRPEAALSDPFDPL
jgi:murein L,D-transpeptidase YafK